MQGGGRFVLTCVVLSSFPKSRRVEQAAGQSPPQESFAVAVEPQRQVLWVLGNSAPQESAPGFRALVILSQLSAVLFRLMIGPSQPFGFLLLLSTPTGDGRRPRSGLVID